MVKTAAKHTTKKRELVAVAEQLFLEKGYAETSIDDILRAAALSKGGFYHYFGSKEEVLTESLNYLLEDSFREIQAVAEDDTLDALEKLQEFMRRKSLVQQPRIEYAKYLRMLMSSDFTLYKFYVSLSQKFLAPLTRIIEQGVSEGLFDVEFPRETADIMVRIAVSTPQSALFGDSLQDKEKYQQYSTAVRTVIARILGIDAYLISKPPVGILEHDAEIDPYVTERY